MQQVKQANLTPKMVFKNQKQFSIKLHKRTLQVVKVILESCDKFENEGDQNENVLFYHVNHYYMHLANVIFNLQQILLDIGKNNSTANKLENVVGGLNKLTFSVQESLKLEPKKLKTNLKANVITTGFEIERSMKLIALDDSHEYKQRILDCQLDLVIHTEKLKHCMQFCNLNQAELEKYARDFIDNVLTIFKQLKTDHV